MGQHAEDLLDYEMGFNSTPYGHSLWDARKGWESKKNHHEGSRLIGLKEVAQRENIPLKKLDNNRYRVLAGGEKWDYQPRQGVYCNARKPSIKIAAKPSGFIQLMKSKIDNDWGNTK